MPNDVDIQRRRSFIFCPGNKPEMLPKALKSGSDMVCIDLEDAIAPEHKALSRNNIIKLFDKAIYSKGVETIIRINELQSDDGKKDIQAILNNKNLPSALMLPKIQHPEEILLLEKQI